MVEIPMKILNPTFSNSSLGHIGKLVWDRKIQLVWGLVFIPPPAILKLDFYMKKTFKFIYPYSYLHSKWWHRLILVFIILGSLLFGIFSGISLANYSIPWSLHYSYVKINNYKDSEFQLACKRDVIYSYYPCSKDAVFLFLEKTDWATQSPITIDGKTFNQIIKEKEIKKVSRSRFSWDNGLSKDDKILIIGELEKNNIIEIFSEYKSNIANIILTILAGIGIFIGSFSVFFSFIYRMILYIIFGFKLGKKDQD